MNIKQIMSRSNKIADSQTRDQILQIANELFADKIDDIYFFTSRSLKIIITEVVVSVENLKSWMDTLGSYDVDIYARNDGKRGLILKFHFNSVD